MEHMSLGEVVDELLEEAHSAPAARAARTIHRGHEHALRQTVIALTSGHELAEHDSPGEATLQVLRGRVELRAGEETWTGDAGDFVLIPPQRHSLHALDDSAVLLTVVVAVREEE